MLLDCGALTKEMRREHVGEARVLDVMRRPCDRRDEAAHALVLATRAGVERGQPLANRLLDAVVVANVEVKEGAVDLRPPVAALQHLVLLDVEGARDDLTFLVPGDDPREAIG